MTAEINALGLIFPAFYYIHHATRKGASPRMKPKVQASVGICGGLRTNTQRGILDMLSKCFIH